MRKRILSTVALAFLVAAVAASQVQAPAQGRDSAPWYAERLEKLGFTLFDSPKAAPDFQVEALAGGAAKLSDFKGRIVLVNFWATWCPPCRAEMPSIQKLWESLKDRSFALMAVSVGESRSTVTSFAKSNRYTMPLHLDPKGAAGDLYGVESIPTTYIVDKNGLAIAYAVGSRDYAGKEALALFAELAAR
jgi:peroxiredoxin